ncbi:uncharacterized protein C4orf54-like [Syngnathoides biaculeatus]|uniref:uncharacterized protein C4orf54-like n=1 Tax=Syngnathoides biaculeatus TaxID=300417 RepID=UPI002ADD6963|nr:uncharacterized protein C4orf54-like [Syngnathoides biaculeatus]
MKPPTLLQTVESDGEENGVDLFKREVKDAGRQMSDLGIETDSDECDEDDGDNVTTLAEDESHYITTHAIRLSELSDGDSDPGAGSSSSSTWDTEDGHQVLSFVDYASFRCNGVLMVTRGQDVAGSALRKRDPSLQFGVCGKDGGQVQLSVKTTPQAPNDPLPESTIYHAKDARDTCPSAEGAADGNIADPRDRAKVAIPAPAGKLQAKESPEYSSCASSELDDTDKEVRNLTARAFKSLAYPYLDAIDFGASSESSASEQGINRWSTFVDLKYSNMSQSLASQPTAEPERGKKNSSDFAQPLNGDAAPHSALSTKRIELTGKFGQGQGGVVRLTETLNFRCNVKSGMYTGERRASVTPSPTGAGSHSVDEVTVNSLLGGRGRGATTQSKSMEGTHKKAIFASSVIQNVLSKKMQFEQERRMERGEVKEAHRKGDCRRTRGLQRQSSKLSETNSDSVDDWADFADCGSRRGPRSEVPGKAMDGKRGGMEVSKGPLLRSHNSAFRCWRNEELEFPQDHKNHQTPEETAPPEGIGDQSLASSGKLTKMSRLFVPNIQCVANGREVQRELQLESDHTLYIAGSKGVAVSKSPEIKINLQSCNAAGLSTADDSKGQEVLAAASKCDSSDKVPHFMVRGIRDGKAKLQTPIHHVRDVRKLVKSSYHFVSLDPESDFASTDSHHNSQHPTSTPQPITAAPPSYGTKTFASKSPKLPTSSKVFPPKTSGESEEILATEQSADNQNYLTIPVKSHTNRSKQGLSVFSTQSHPTDRHLHIPASGSKSQRSSGAALPTHSTEVPAATIYHSVPLGMSANQPQVYCFSPAITPAPVLDSFQATQRKMLLDPTSGSYYLVDTPAQPSTRRLLDPETGHYVEIPMLQPPVTPVPMTISPLALGSAAYGHAYMIYPGFVTSPPVISTPALVQPQVQVESSEKALPHRSEGMYMETPLYMTTGKATAGAPNVVSIARPRQGFPGGKQPVISITSQEGPRIIAPPSFDGTTMSFVVEHR